MTGLMHNYRRVARVTGKRAQYAIMRSVFPRNAEERALAANGPRVFANSIPKAGTNLLMRLLRTMPNVVGRWTYHIDETLPGGQRQLRACRRGQAVSAHYPWEAELAELVRELDMRPLLMVRDPRDIAVSNVNYVTRMDVSHPLHPTLAAQNDDSERLLTMIAPPDSLLRKLPAPWRNEGLATFMPWIQDPDCLVVRFEDLIGARGGGSDARQRETVQAIAKHVGAVLSEQDIARIAGSLFGSGTKTFHKGQIGSWKMHFDEAHKEAFKRRSGKILVALGYEDELDW